VHAFKRLLRIAERHTVRPASTRKAQPREPGVFDDIDNTQLDNIIGGRTVATGQTDPKLLQGVQGLAQAIEATGKALAGRQVSDFQQSMQMMDMMGRKGGGQGGQGGGQGSRG